MPDVFQELCPLSGHPAIYEFAVGDGGKRKWFRCEKCKSFIITDTAEKRLASSPAWKKQISDLSAEQPDDKLVHIFVPNPSPDDPNNQFAVQWEIDLKSKWLRLST